jgi:cellulose biosynthesis protein BcsQ
MKIETPGRIVTFYSYKGGTGRSMALANFAWILAASGNKVLTIDWDLEAPGLHRYFRPFLIDPDLFETDGLIDTFWSFAAAAMETAQRRGPSGEPHDQINDGTMIDQTKRRLNWKFSTEGYIDFVGAGRQGATYSERVNTFDWKRFYELGGARMLNSAKDYLKAKYDWVLIDSRTGVSDTSGICTMQLPDTVVACFTMNRQSIDGVDAIIRSIRLFRSPTVDGSIMKFFPMATRIENAEKERLEIARSYAREKLAEFVPKVTSRARAYWDDMEVAYRPYYAFEEILSGFGDATGSSRAVDTMLAQMEAMAQCIAGDDRLRMPEILEVDRQQILAKYSLGKRVISLRKAPVEPSKIDNDDALDDSRNDVEFLRGLLAKEQLWQKNNFAPTHLLSSRELDLLTESDRKQFGRSMSYYLVNSERGQIYFRRLGLAFALCVLTIGAVLSFFGYIIASVGSSLKPEAPIIMVSVLTATWVATAVLGSLWASWAGDPPYGTRFADTFRRLLTGRVGSQISDYNPDDRRR